MEVKATLELKWSKVSLSVTGKRLATSFVQNILFFCLETTKKVTKNCVIKEDFDHGNVQKIDDYAHSENSTLVEPTNN